VHQKWTGLDYTTVPAAFKIDTQFKSGQKSAQK